MQEYAIIRGIGQRILKWNQTVIRDLESSKENIFLLEIEEDARDRWRRHKEKISYNDRIISQVHDA